MIQHNIHSPSSNSSQKVKRRDPEHLNRVMTNTRHHCRTTTTPRQTKSTYPHLKCLEELASGRQDSTGQEEEAMDEAPTMSYIAPQMPIP